MVAAGMGICFLPDYTASFAGVVGCPVVSYRPRSSAMSAWSASQAVAGHRLLWHQCKRFGVIRGRLRPPKIGAKLTRNPPPPISLIACIAGSQCRELIGAIT